MRVLKIAVMFTACAVLFTACASIKYKDIDVATFYKDISVTTELNNDGSIKKIVYDSRKSNIDPSKVQIIEAVIAAYGVSAVK